MASVEGRIVAGIGPHPLPSPPMHHATLATIALLIALAPTLAAQEAPAEFRVTEHAVFIHADGRAREALEPHEIGHRGVVVGARLSPEAEAQQLSRLMAAVRSSPHDTILIYVHGGRISYEKGYNRVAVRGATIDSAGYYPIFINWNSSAGSSLWWHLFRIRQGQDWGPLRGTLSSPFMIAGSVGRALSRAPMSLIHQTADYCRVLGGMHRGDTEGRLEGSRFCPIPGVDQARRAQAEYEQALLSSTAPPGQARVPLALGIGTHDLGWGEGTMRVASGVFTAVPKLATGMILDGFGPGSWSEMRRRVGTMVHSRRDLSLPASLDPDYHPPRGAAYALLDSLQEMARAQDADSLPAERRRSRVFILAGHSMGTIVIDELLEHFPDLPVSRIIYLAPATTVAELETGVVRFLLRHPTTLYYHGMLHPYADAGEWQPGMLDLVPRGSLLEWVDDYLATPDTPLDRVSGKWSNLVTATHIFPPEVRERVVLKAFGVRDPFDRDDPVLYDAMREHAGFSNPAFAFWDDSSWRLRPYRSTKGFVRAPQPPGTRQAKGTTY